MVDTQPTPTQPPVVLDLCGGSGSWSKPYKDAGYEVFVLDLELGYDIHDWRTHLQHIQQVHGILAAPPCTHFTVAANRLYAVKDESGLTEEAADIVRQCLAVIHHYQPTWWALENPIGRIRSVVPELGRPAHSFHPYYYGDPWTKGTHLWGRFNKLKRTDVMPIGTISQFVRNPKDRAKTPEGFARAFYEANP